MSLEMPLFTDYNPYTAIMNRRYFGINDNVFGAQLEINAVKDYLVPSNCNLLMNSQHNRSNIILFAENNIFKSSIAVSRGRMLFYTYNPTKLHMMITPDGTYIYDLKYPRIQY